MKEIARFRFFAVCGLAAALFGSSCGKKDAARPPDPPRYDRQTIKRVSELINDAYGMVGGADSAGIFAKLDEARSLAPGTIMPEYAALCAHSLAGRTDEAFQSLERLVQNGLDYAEMLENDSDLDSLRGDPRFAALLERARENYERNTAFLARGLPKYDAASDTFSTVESLEQWKNDEDGVRMSHGLFWTRAQGLSAQSGTLARYLANMKKLKASDPSFDEGLERVRAAGRMAPLYSQGWGAVSDLVKREADAYMKSPTAREHAAEANYIAAVALSMKRRGEDERRLEAYRAADAYLDRVGEGNEYSGAARALRLANRVASPDADMEMIGKELSALIEESPNDDRLHGLVTARLGPEAVRLLWPLRLEAIDIDGKALSLDQYAGKVLLIDFWATWCAPCRIELPGLVAAYEKYHDRGLEIVSISLDYAERVSAPALRDSIAAHGMAWRHVYTGAGWKTEHVKRWFVGSIPAPFLVGRDGSLAAWGKDLRGRNLAPAIEKAL